MGMIACKCPSCGADIQLDDSREFGFCNYCGTKVIQDKVVVEHRGSVKIDNSEYVEKYLMSARIAKKKRDWEETEKAYKLVEQNDPTNKEAIFYSTFAKAYLSLSIVDERKRDSAFSALSRTCKILSDMFTLDAEETERELLKQIDGDVYELLNANYIRTSQEQESEKVLGFVSHHAYLEQGFKELIRSIIKKYPEGDKRIIDYYEMLMRYANNATAKEIHEEWHKLDPSHEIPYIPENNVSKSSGGCYVATAVYGSYDCPQVWTLRRYRDYTLAETWYGRAFIHTYYAISPTLVKWFGKTNWFKNMWKPRLDKMVRKLQKSGIESTPYEDRKW